MFPWGSTLKIGLSKSLDPYSQSRSLGSLPPFPSCQLVAPKMVRTYVRKGGWGGARAGSGNKPGHWEAQGGRAAAASAKVKFKKELKAAIEEKRQKLDECWSLWSNKVCRSPPPECCARMSIS